MYMKDWAEKLDGILISNEKEVLIDSGSVSHKDMEQKVRQELAKYNQKALKNK